LSWLVSFFASLVTFGILVGMVIGVVLAAMVAAGEVNLTVVIALTVVINLLIWLISPWLMAREREARAKRRGVWGSSAYRIASALDVKRLGRLIHSYQLVEGRVASVGEGGGRLSTSLSASSARLWAPSPPPASTLKPLPERICACGASSPGATTP